MRETPRSRRSSTIADPPDIGGTREALRRRCLPQTSYSPKTRVRGYDSAVIGERLDELEPETIEKDNGKGKVLCSERIGKNSD